MAASEVQSIAFALKAAPKWRIICHVRPDGDTLGCGSALMCAAALLGKDAVWGGADPLPPLYRFLPFAEEYRVSEDITDDGRCVIAVDVSTRDRGIPSADVALCVDHHRDNEGFATCTNWVVPEAAATGELLLQLIYELGCPVTPEIAKALYVAIVTDCGWFRYSNTTENTLRAAAELVRAGAVPSEIDELLDYNDTMQKMRLWGRCLSRVERHGGKGVLSWVSCGDFLETGAAEADTEGLVNMLTHIAVFEVPAYHKLLVCSDVAIIPAPDFKQKQAMLNYIISTAKSLEIAKPKVAVIAATEQVSVGMRACSEGAWLGMMSQRGQLKGAIVDGPLSLDCSIDKESAMTKKLTSEVAGDADGLLFPNIESGNVFYKTCTKFAGAELACMVVGAKVPCVLTSRGDSIQSKLYSIALAALNTK